jgi:hypothetical protein
MYHLYPGSGIPVLRIRIWDSSAADPDLGFSAFFALLITGMAWSCGYEYVVAK